MNSCWSLIELFIPAEFNKITKQIEIKVHLATCHQSARARKFIYNNNNDADRRITNTQFLRLADKKWKKQGKAKVKQKMAVVVAPQAICYQQKR